MIKNSKFDNLNPRNMKTYILLIFLVFLCFTACKKENKNENLCYSSTLVSQIYSGDLAVHGLTYNSNCLIYESTEPYTYKRFSYDTNDRLKKVEVATSFNSFSCVMIPGQSIESDPRKAEISQYSEFEYDDALRLIKKSNYSIINRISKLTSYQTYNYQDYKIIKLNNFNPEGLLTGFHDYKYDDNGNITRDDSYVENSGTKLVSTRIYEFDNKNNPYQIFTCEGNPGKYTNRNNAIKETSISYNGTYEYSNSVQNTYEYNNLNYPIKINGLVCWYGK